MGTMKVAIVLFACIAYAAASGYYQPGFKHIGKAVVAPYRNAERQRAVNKVAEKVGSGTGTARYYGVPGADGHYRHYGYGHDGYGNSYGYNSYGHGLGRGHFGGHFGGHRGFGFGHGRGFGHGFHGF